MASDCDTLERQLPQAVWTGDGLLPNSLSPGTQHKIAGRGSDLSAHEPVTVEVDAVSFTDVTTGRSDHTFSRADTTNSYPSVFPEFALPMWAGYQEQIRSRLAQMKMKSAQ